VAIKKKAVLKGRGFKPRFSVSQWAVHPNRIKETLPAFDKTPHHLKVAALRPPITRTKNLACKGIDGFSNPQLVALVTHQGLQFLVFSYLWDFFRFWDFAQLMSGLWNERAS